MPTVLISLIVIRIVVVMTLSDGLTRYALEMVVGVRVLELIRLTAALFAAMRCRGPNAAKCCRAACPAYSARGCWRPWAAP